jgi:sugar lactone lactonase YvrE
MKTLITALTLGLLSITSLQPATAQNAFTPDNIFVSGSHTDEPWEALVMEFTPEGEHVRTIIMEPGVEGRAYGLAFGPDGRLYVGDNGSDKIFAVSPDGSAEVFVDGEGGLSDVDGLTFGPKGNLYAAGRDNGEVVVIDPNGNAVDWLDPGKPNAIGFAPDGTIMVTDQNLGRVVLYNNQNVEVGLIGDAQLTSYCGNPVWGPGGNIYVGNYGSGNIAVFGPDGNFIGTISNGSMGGPYGLALGPDGRIYVADYGTDSVVVLGSDLALENAFTHEDLTYPAYVAVAPYVFKAKLKGDTFIENTTKPTKLADKSALLSISPGSGTIMIAAGSDEFAASIGSPWMVFHGFAAVSSTSKKRRAHGTEAASALGEATLSSIDLLLSGKVAPSGLYQLKSASGTLHRASATQTWHLTVKGGKLLKP